MKRISVYLAAALVAIACASPEKMAKMADDVVAQCNPAVLEVVNGAIDASVSVTYPKDYFNPQVILKVTPVIVYEGGEAAMTPFKYQGEKVKDNYKVVSAAGQTVTEKLHFDYVEGMEKCYLELRGVVIAGEKQIALPAKRVAQGANTTYMLVKPATNLAFKKDNYQDVVVSTAEGQIKYQINSSDVRSSELKGASVKEFIAALDAAAKDERASIGATEIVAYASPDGAESLNNTLSGNRGESANKAWKSVTKGTGAAAPAVRSIGEDWEGFQELVKESNLEDKDLILRVLSMYSDPAVRENEIKNMSQVYTALKGEVLPELRRARLIANIEYKNYSKEELLDLLEGNDSILDEEALLRCASLVKDAAQKESIYKKAVKRFGSERAQYNLAVLYLGQGQLEKAEAGLKAVKTVDADVMNAYGVLAVKKDELKAAKDWFVKSGSPESKANLGAVLILTGDYEQAARVLEKPLGCCHNSVLALILTDQLDKAMSTAHCGDPKVWYLKAVIAARQDKAADVKKYLEKAYKKADLKARAASDIEFAGFEI